VLTATRSRLAAAGPDGNERLTALAGLVLLALLLIELATIPGLRQHVTVHMFIGLLLVPPLLLKLASTGWRFSRYYSRNAQYQEKGPPQLVMRLLAPLLILASLALIGSGTLLVFETPAENSGALGLHKASFVVWLVLVSAHVLYYLPRLPGLLKADWSRRVRSEQTEVPTETPVGTVVAGRASRVSVTLVALLAGVVFALGTLPLDHHWASYLQQHGHFGG
jgi:hypothetical protein